MEKSEPSCTVGGNVNWYSLYGRRYGDSFKKLGIKPLYDPAIPLLGIYPEEIKTCEKDTCTPMFTAALFTIAKTWKQPRCPSTDEWIRKLYIYTMEYYSAIKRNAFESVLMRWMNWEPLIQSEVNQKEKYKYVRKWNWSRSVVSDSLRPVDCSLPGSSLHGILQARVLEWVAISFSNKYVY